MTLVFKILYFVNFQNIVKNFFFHFLLFLQTADPFPIFRILEGLRVEWWKSELNAALSLDTRLNEQMKILNRKPVTFTVTLYAPAPRLASNNNNNNV